ncbi:MAG: HAD-IIB family hydrolase [Ruminococcus sp.]|nr:HAD-IIB family hydrolase [Ruminococcus sp.]
MIDISRLTVLTDLDGTLLPATKQIPDEDIAVIRRFQAAGGRFTIATGRTLEAALPYLDLVRPNAPAILYNGAMIYDHSRQAVVRTKTLPANAEEYLRRILSLEGLDIGAEILCADGTYVVQMNDTEAHHISVCGVTPHHTTLADMKKDGWLKILFALEPEQVDRLITLVSDMDFPGVTFVRSERIFLEMLPAGVSKGETLASDRARFTNDSGILIGAGDFHNDLELITAADVGICPSNAQPVVKESASLILEDSCNDHAIARFLERLLAGETFGLSLSVN